MSLPTYLQDCKNTSRKVNMRVGVYRLTAPRRAGFDRCMSQSVFVDSVADLALETEEMRVGLVQKSAGKCMLACSQTTVQAEPLTLRYTHREVTRIVSSTAFADPVHILNRAAGKLL